jgi:hypothetical protein
MSEFKSELKQQTEKREKDLEEFQRIYITTKLMELTLEQQEFFNKIYPDGLRKDQLLNAANQIERTIAKNTKKAR